MSDNFPMKVELNKNGMSAETGESSKALPVIEKKTIFVYLGLILGVMALFSSGALLVFEAIFKVAVVSLLQYLDYPAAYYFMIAAIIRTAIALTSVIYGIGSVIIFSKENSTANLIGLIVSVMSFIISTSIIIANIIRLVL